MSSPSRKLWADMKDRGEGIGSTFFIMGVVIIFVIFGLTLSGSTPNISLLGASFGLISVGLGFIALSVAAKSDKRHTELLQRLDRNLLKVLDKFEPELDTIEPAPVQTITPKPVEVKTGVGKVKVVKGTKAEAQKRLDNDTKRVGYVRGEIYQLQDGSWGIHWGGKYSL